MLQIPNKEIIILSENKDEVLARLNIELRRFLPEDQLAGLGLADFDKNYTGRLLKKKTLRKLDKMLENVSEAEKTRLANLVRLTSLYPQNKSERSLDVSDSGAEIFIN